MTQVESEKPPIEILLMTEKKDEDQIIKTMRGEVVKEWVYQIQQGGRTITQLSYAGVKEAIRRRGNINWKPCDCCRKPVHTEESADEIRAVVTAWDLNTNVQFLGAAEALKKQPFAWRLAVNKAERNALRKFLPEKSIALLIEEYLQREHSKPPPGGKLQ